MHVVETFLDKNSELWYGKKNFSHLKTVNAISHFSRKQPISDEISCFIDERAVAIMIT